jgi:hypothetical protein
VRKPAKYVINGSVNIESLINFVFPELDNDSVLPDPGIFAIRAILSPTSIKNLQINFQQKSLSFVQQIRLCEILRTNISDGTLRFLTV